MHFVDALEQLSKVIYIGPFRHALSSSSEKTYYDLTIGKPLMLAWDQMKNSVIQGGFPKSKKVTEALKRVFGYHHLDIQLSHEQNDLLVTVDDNKRHSMSEMGSGFTQLWVVLANLVRSEPSFILIDEPELNLHPALQAQFISTLSSFATRGVVFATHNVGLARTSADRIYTVRRSDDHTHPIVRPWDKTGRLSELLGEIGFRAFQDLGFEKILLVEGPTEIKAIQQVLRMLGKDNEIVLIPLGGSSMINGRREAELEELKRISENVYALIDGEKASPEASWPRERSDFHKTCTNAGIKCHITERRSLDNYMSDSAVKKAIGVNVQALGPFERLKDPGKNGWGKSENWRIAIHMSATEWLENDVGKFLSEI